MKDTVYVTLAGEPFTVTYDPELPCAICDLPIIRPSFSGTNICPWCDSGVNRDSSSWTYEQFIHFIERRQMKTRYRIVQPKCMDIFNPTEYPEAILYNLARYKFAANMLKLTDSVVDVACGKGLGTAFLSNYVDGDLGHVWGVDNDPQNISVAFQRYKIDAGNEHLTFLEADAIQFLRASSVKDAIVSFDTIEHLENPQQFVRLASKTLRNSGLFICGTPRRQVLKARNDDHFHEFEAGEFFSLLSKHFHRVLPFGQLDEVVGTFNQDHAWYLIGVCFNG